MTKYSKFTVIAVLTILAALANYLLNSDEGYLSNIAAATHALLVIAVAVGVWIVAVGSEFINEYQRAKKETDGQMTIDANGFVEVKPNEKDS